MIAVAVVAVVAVAVVVREEALLRERGIERRYVRQHTIQTLVPIDGHYRRLPSLQDRAGMLVPELHPLRLRLLRPPRPR